MTGNGTPPSADKNLGEIVSEVSEKASLLVRQEIELAKAEITDKVGKLTRGAAIAAAAGVFLIFGITMFFHTLAWFLFDIRAAVPARDPRRIRCLPAVQEGRAAHARPRDRGGQAHPRAVRDTGRRA